MKTLKEKIERLKEKIKPLSRLNIVVLIALLVIGTPILLSQIIRIPTGQATIGSEDAWVSFFGSYLGGVFGMVGVIFTTYLIINNNKKNIEHSMQLEDKKIRDREVTIVLLNKSEEVAERLENFTGLLSRSVSLFIRMSIYSTTIKDLDSLKRRADPSEVESIDNEIKRFKDVHEELSNQSISIRPLVIDSLNNAIAKSIYFNQIRNDIIAMKEFVIEQEDIITDVIYHEQPDVVDQLGKNLINEISDRLNPIQAKVARFSLDQLNKLKKGE